MELREGSGLAPGKQMGVCSAAAEPAHSEGGLLTNLEHPPRNRTVPAVLREHQLKPRNTGPPQAEGAEQHKSKGSQALARCDVTRSLGGEMPTFWYRNKVHLP